MNQWRNTKSVIEWFKATKNESKSSFIKFDIVDFYPSISKELLLKAIKYAQTVTNIQEKVIKMIYHARKSLLFDKGNEWVKKIILNLIRQWVVMTVQICVNQLDYIFYISSLRNLVNKISAYIEMLI